MNNNTNYSMTIDELVKTLKDYSEKHPENYGADNQSDDYKAGYIHAINVILSFVA